MARRKADFDESSLNRYADSPTETDNFGLLLAIDAVRYISSVETVGTTAIKNATHCAISTQLTAVLEKLVVIGFIKKERQSQGYHVRDTSFQNTFSQNQYSITEKGKEYAAKLRTQTVKT